MIYILAVTCYSISDYQGHRQQRAFVQYSFDNLEHPIEVKPHGNSKGKMPFSRSKPSTLSLLKTISETKPPTQALAEVENIRGGVMNAQSGCDLPRNRKQVYNLVSAKKRHEQKIPSLPSSVPRTDVLAQVMHMCKDTSGSQAYVRAVEAAPEPMCVLATDQQLADMERFATHDPSTVISIDPTFNLGPFYVTPITYQNLLVKTAKGNHPVLLGPVLVHQTKTFRPFHYFASTLVRLNPQLIRLKAFATDGESELIKAFGVTFPEAVHLRCTNHLRQNIKDKLRALNIPQDAWKEFLADIFGAQIGSHFETGLIDAQSESIFWKSLDGIKERWNNLERSYTPISSEPQFHEWFCRYKATDIVACVLPSVRAMAGVEDPSVHFTTNNSEALNHIIKYEVNWKESKLPTLIGHLKCISDRHAAELEKAVIGRGEWQFTLTNSHLQVPEVSWFSMCQEAKEKHMKRVFSEKVMPPRIRSTIKTPITSRSQSCEHTSLTDPGSSTATQADDNKENASPSCTGVLGIAVGNCGITTVSLPILQGMWKKAENLVQCTGDILKLPWSSDAKARLVKSSSSDHPHVVKTNPRNMWQYLCDDKCPMYKAYSLCSHVIAAAHDNSDLHTFLQYYTDSQRGPNLTAIAIQGMPVGSGRKGGIPKHKRNRKATPIQTRSVRPCLQTSTGDNNLKLAISDSGLHSLAHSSHLGTSGSSQLLYATPNPEQHLQDSSSSSRSGSVASALSTSVGPNQVQSPCGPTPCDHDYGSSAPVCTLSICTGQNQGQSTRTPNNHEQYCKGAPSNLCASVLDSPAIPALRHLTAPQPQSTWNDSTLAQGKLKENPFILKFKTNQIKICQACRQNYEGENDTLGLVVAHAERRMVSNLATGMQFLGRESNSHYHAHMRCLRMVKSSFMGRDLVIPTTVQENLTPIQKIYLATCLQASIAM